MAQKLVLVALSLIAILGGSALTHKALAGQSATVITVSTIPTTSLFTVGVEIPKTVANQSFDGKKNSGVDVSITYISMNNTIETVDSGVVPISTTDLVGAIDSNTDAIQLTISYAGHPAPISNPSYTTTATLVKP